MVILIADPQPAQRENLRGVVEMLGYRPMEAADPHEAMAEMRMNHPEIALVVVAWDFPDTTHGELVRRIRSDGRFGQVPIMVMLEDAEAAEAITAFQEGATECATRTTAQQDLATRMLECLGHAA
jgi:two-component system chemotaxis response regulator CheY